MNGQSKAIKEDIERHLTELDVKFNEKEYINLVHTLAGELMNRIDSEDLFNVIIKGISYEIKNQIEECDQQSNMLYEFLKQLNPEKC